MSGVGRTRLAGGLGSLLAGMMICGVLLGGCASGTLTTYRYESPDGVLDLYLNWYPERSTTGGAIRLAVAGRVKPVVVVRLSIETFAAVTPECPADGCVIVKDENHFHCTCDGSWFSLDGTVARGPAEQPLESFRTEYRSGMVKVYLK